MNIMKEDEEEKRMNVVGQNGNTGAHYKKAKVLVMLDLETLSTKSNAAILSIGATTFAKELTLGTSQEIIDDKFYSKVDPLTYKFVSESEQFDVCPETKAWWNKQPEHIRKEAFSGVHTLADNLIDFNHYIDSIHEHHNAEVCLMSNGSNFDIPIIRYAMDFYGIVPQWKYYNEFCYRTLKNMFASEYREAEARLIRVNIHSALADAEYQAEVATFIMKELRKKGVYLWE